MSKFGINVVGIRERLIWISLHGLHHRHSTALSMLSWMPSHVCRDTSASHERCSVVEVSGPPLREIALWAGLATGADAIMIPEDKESADFERVVRIILENRARGKNHNIIIVSEGVGGSQELAKRIHEVTGIDSRTTILGHIQREDVPTAWMPSMRL
ncbi:MAG: 6-phosphofructokinase [Clostridia bacterium]